MTDYLTIGGAAAAAVATALGIVVAIEQLTLPARLRRLEVWARELADKETNQVRADTLQLIRTITTARLVAGLYAPGWYFVSFLVWTGLGATLIIASFLRDGSWSDRFGPISFVLVFSGLMGRRAIRVWLERQRIGRAYVEGTKPITPARLTLMSQMEGGTRREFVLGFILAAGFTGLCSGIGWFASGNRSIWPFGVAMTGFLLIGVVVDELRKHTVIADTLRETDKF